MSTNIYELHICQNFDKNVSCDKLLMPKFWLGYDDKVLNQSLILNNILPVQSGNALLILNILLIYNGLERLGDRNYVIT